MNKIFFDLSVCQPNQESKFHGGGVYGYIVFKQLAIATKGDLTVYYSKSSFVDPSVRSLIANMIISEYDADEFSIEDAYRQSGADIVYTPLLSITHRPLIEKGVKYVVTIHGLRTLEMLTDTMESSYATSLRMWIKIKIKQTLLRKYIYHRNYNRYKLALEKENVHVVTVSNHSKYSLKCYYPQLKVDDITVLYSPSTTVPNYEKYKIGSKEKYILLVSADRWLKNAGRAISAIDMLFDTNPNMYESVKVLGLKEKTKVYKSIKHKEKFELLGYQTQEDLECLYASAYVFIFPSLNEGFGYPPLESMKYGIPVIASPFSSITEICGDAVLYANPYSVEEIANRILQLEDIEIYEKYQDRGIKRYDLINNKQVKDLNCLCNYLLSI